jgi:hypothetical protein
VGKRFQTDDSLDCRKLAFNVLDERQKLGFQEQNPGLAVIQNVENILSREANVQGKQDCPGLDHAVIGFEQAVTIATQKRNDISPTNPQVGDDLR